MKAPLSAIFSLHLVTALCIAISGANAAEDAEVKKLLEELASESFKTREAASRRLWEVGVDVIPALREASRSDDPERAFRAADVLQKLELRITTETPAEVLSLIDSYGKAAPQEKSKILSELRRNKAYFQLLKLYSMERPEAKVTLAPGIAGFAIVGAREAIVSDDIEAAIDMLRMSSGDYRDLMALATLYRSIGRLDEELENPNPPENVPTDLWKITLLRVKGDIEGAMKLAARRKQLRLLGALKVLSGDPVLWLQQNGMGDGRQKAQEAYIDVALKRWKGDPVLEADYAPLYRLLESRKANERSHAMTSLASLGKLEQIEQLQVKQSPASAFLYHLSQENIDEALKAFGLDPEKPDYGGWVETRLKAMKAEDVDNRRVELPSVSELAMMAGFLERRGLHQELSKAFSGPLAKYSKDDENGYMDLLEALFEAASGAPRFASDQAEKWAGDDEARWSEVFAMIFGEEEEVTAWLDWINEIEPDMSRRESLDAMLALFRITTSPGGLRAMWIGKAWKVVDETKDEGRQLAHIKRILSLSIIQEDVVNALKAWDMLEPDEQASATWNTIDKYLSAAGRWAEAAEIFEKSRDMGNNTSAEEHAYFAATLRRAGFEERACEHDEWADKLALGDLPSNVRIGSRYAFAGDQKRAAIWYKRAVLEADVSEGEFVAVLNNYADSMLLAGDWMVAASCYEALVQVYASQEYVDGALALFAKERLSADLAKAMAILPQNRKMALEILEGIHNNFATDGILADDFFPLIRKAGLKKELERWFGESWERIALMVKKYPESHNTKNTAAWFASRAVMKLDEAEKFLQEALDQSPEQPAYLDTMAEVNFAKGDRKAAVKWSDRAVSLSPFDDMIRLQNDRFKNEKLPEN